MRRQAEVAFHCVVIHSFLYWPDRDDLMSILCVPLMSDSNHLNLQVQACLVYRLGRQRGLDFIEPLAPAIDEDDSRRLDAFFNA